MKGIDREVETKYISMKQIIEPDYKAREAIDKTHIDELSVSIRERGLINAISVKAKGQKYEIIAGHCRFLAAKKLGLKDIRCTVVIGTLLEQELRKLDENVKRKDLDDIEEALYYTRLKKLGIKTNLAIGKHVGKSESYVTQKLAILKYPDYMYDAIKLKKLTFSAARELIRINDKVVLKDYVNHAVDSGITPALAKVWVDDWLNMQKYSKEDAEKKGDNITHAEPERIKVPCFVCGHHFLVENTTMIRVCKSDLEAIIKAMKIVIKEEEE